MTEARQIKELMLLVNDYRTEIEILANIEPKGIPSWKKRITALQERAAAIVGQPTQEMLESTFRRVVDTIVSGEEEHGDGIDIVVMREGEE